MDKKQRIQELNDALRKHGTGGMVVLTKGVQQLEERTRKSVFQAVQTFDDFNRGNDPHHEHDFGSFTVGEHKLFWKIDYYNRTLDGGAKDPSDAATTERVLTIMLRHEY